MYCEENDLLNAIESCGSVVRYFEESNLRDVCKLCCICKWNIYYLTEMIQIAPTRKLIHSKKMGWGTLSLLSKECTYWSSTCLVASRPRSLIRACKLPHRCVPNRPLSYAWRWSQLSAAWTSELLTRQNTFWAGQVRWSQNMNVNTKHTLTGRRPLAFRMSFLSTTRIFSVCSTSVLLSFASRRV